MAIDANGQELNVGDKVFYIVVRCGCKRPKIGIIEKICPQKVKISNGPHQKHSHVAKIINSTSKNIQKENQLELFS